MLPLALRRAVLNTCRSTLANMVGISPYFAPALAMTTPCYEQDSLGGIPHYTLCMSNRKQIHGGAVPCSCNMDCDNLVRDAQRAYVLYSS
jgi:hypothetical protein